MKSKVLNIANCFSVLRLILSFPIYIAIINKNNFLFFSLIVIAVLTDYLDGYFARKYNQITEIGKVLDPLADKIIIGVASLALFQVNVIPLWFISVVIARDIIIFTGGIIYTSKYKFVIPSNKLGKLTVNILCLLLLLAYLIHSEYNYILYIIASIFLALSLYSYIINIFKLHNSVSLEK